MKPLTDAQQRLLEAIRHHWHTYSHAPTLAELAEVLNYSNPTGVVYHLSGLARAGLVAWDDRSGRTLKVVGETYADLVNRIAELGAARSEMAEALESDANDYNGARPPGPWFVYPDPGRQCDVCLDVQAERWCVGWELTYGGEVGVAVVLADEREDANAHLIAAAPDLLAFAKWFLANRDGPGRSMASNAIAKAEPQGATHAID